MSRPADLLIELVDEVERTRGRLRSLFGCFNDPEGPTGLAMTVLTAVVRAINPPTVPQIGRSLGYPRQSIQRHADELFAQGLIAFVENPHHKRAQCLIATPAGAELYGRANVRGLAWAERSSRSMDPKQLADAVSILRTLRKQLEDEMRQGSAPDRPENERD